MNEVQQEKYILTAHYLTPLLVYATDSSVAIAKYRVDGASVRVDVRFSNGYTKSVNVTGDSMLALVSDVLKAVR